MAVARWVKNYASFRSTRSSPAQPAQPESLHRPLPQARMRLQWQVAWPTHPNPYPSREVSGPTSSETLTKLVLRGGSLDLDIDLSPNATLSKSSRRL